MKHHPDTQRTIRWPTPSMRRSLVRTAGLHKGAGRFEILSEREATEIRQDLLIGSAFFRGIQANAGVAGKAKAMGHREVEDDGAGGPVRRGPTKRQAEVRTAAGKWGF